MQYFGVSILTLLGLASSLQCTEVNGGHNTWSTGPRFRLEVHPRIEEWSPDGLGKKLILHKKNEPLNMTCTVVHQSGEKEDSSLFEYIVDWKVPRNVNDNPKIERGQSRNTAWIWFERVAEEDAGNYTCNALSAKPFGHQPTLTVYFHLFVEHKPKFCGSEWFRCHSKNCIMERYVCDGKQDCEGGEDESPAAGCPPDPCIGKIFCEERCIPPEWCCDHRNCSGTFGLRPWPHENPNQISYVQTAFYTVIGCAMAFMFIVTILVIAICKVQIKRAMNSRCSQQIRTPCTRRAVPLYDLDVYFNRTAEVNYPGGVSIMYNINSGVQFVGRPTEPPPYSEVVAEPPREGPPPPYVSCENLIVRQANPRFVEGPDAAVINGSASLAVNQSIKDDGVTPSDTDIRGSQCTTSGHNENSIPNIPGPQVATHSNVSQALTINSHDSNTAFVRGNSLLSRDSVDAPSGSSDSSRSRPLQRPNFELEYVETDPLLVENPVDAEIPNTKTIVWKSCTRHSLLKSRWLNNESNDKNPQKHWHRQRFEKTVKECASRGREASSLKDSENEGVFLDTDQQDSTPAESTSSGESDIVTGFPTFVNIANTSKAPDTNDEMPNSSSTPNNDAASSLLNNDRRESKLLDYQSSVDIANPTVFNNKKTKSEMKASRDEISKNGAFARRSSQATSDKSFLRGIKRQSSLTSGEIRSKNLSESSASASTGTIDSANSRVDDNDGNSQIRELSSLVLPLRESFIGVQRDS